MLEVSLWLMFSSCFIFQTPAPRIPVKTEASVHQKEARNTVVIAQTDIGAKIASEVSFPCHKRIIFFRNNQIETIFVSN